MVTGIFKILLSVLLHIFLFIATGHAQPGGNEKHILVSMRMIGHETLLNSSDSTSRVLPIEKKGNSYKIRFASGFQFRPEILVATIDSIIRKTGIAKGYLVEVEKCETGEVVYSCEIGGPDDPDLIPCGTRMQDKACYNILITILDLPVAELANVSSYGKKAGGHLILALLLLSFTAVTGLFVYIRKKRQPPMVHPIDPAMIAIRRYRFDKLNSELLTGDQRIELSAKESELLILLYNAANTTVAREVILKDIWGDEGDYVGRTLDVFISRLRKKLETDTSVKIVNIRGIGYKLVMRHSP